MKFQMIGPGAKKTTYINAFNELEGVGALQISFTKRSIPNKPNNKEAVKLSLSYAESQNWKVGATMVQVSRIDESFVSAMTYYISGEEITSWRIWHIVENTRVACNTYNCAKGDEIVEADSVDGILRSFKWRR